MKRFMKYTFLFLILALFVTGTLKVFLTGTLVDTFEGLLMYVASYVMLFQGARRGALPRWAERMVEASLDEEE